MTTQKVPPAKPAPDAEPPPALIVFGYDENDVACAAWYPEQDREPALYTAAVFEGRAAEVVGDNGERLARLLRRGEPLAGIRKFAPIITGDLMRELEAYAKAHGIVLPPSRPAAQPDAWRDLKIGHIVLALDGDIENGWWEAMVIGKAETKLILRWRYEPTSAAFERALDHVALLPAASISTY